MAYSPLWVPTAIHGSALLSFHVSSARAAPVTALSERLRQPPMGRMVFS